jgi:heme exporter protein A
MPDYRKTHDADAPPLEPAGMSGNAHFLCLSGRELACVRGDRQVFSGLGFEASGGEVLALTGPNGAGKTTLLRLIAGLLRPAAGKLALAGGDADASLAEQVHYVGHQDALKPALSVRENLRFWSEFLGGASSEAGCAAALRAVELDSLGDLPAAYLSAGQRRRLALARLVAVKRPVWLLDEPTSALDAASQEKLGGLLQMHLSNGGIVVAATHGPLPVAASRELRLGGAR